MKKKLVATVLVLTFISLFAITPAEAGSKIRQSWQGAGIALGALLLGGLVIQQMAVHASSPQVVYAPPPEARYHPQREWVPGHWEITREWVPGTWERVWVPSHYDGRGHWVADHTINRKVPGYYDERKVWVEGYYRQR
jgi:hypothetical protein